MREEAAGITLASKWALENWKGKIIIYSDNESAINSAKYIQSTPHRKWIKTKNRFRTRQFTY